MKKKKVPMKMIGYLGMSLESKITGVFTKKIK